MAMKSYQRKGSVKAEPFTESTTAATKNDATVQATFAAGDYLVVDGGKVYGMNKSEFEAEFGSRTPQRKKGTGTAPVAPTGSRKGVGK